MMKAHKIKILPTNAQKTLIHKSFGCARHSYNWALNQWEDLYKLGQRPTSYGLVKLQNSIKKEQMPFYLDVSKFVVQCAVHNVERAFKKMWEEGAGYPKFKKKGDRDSFVSFFGRNKFKQSNGKIHLPRIGWVKSLETLRFSGDVINVVVARVADIYFVIVNIEVSESTPILKQVEGNNQAIVGVDLGIKSMMVLSDGTIYENPKAFRTNLKNLKRLQKGLSRKVKGSKNSKRQQIKVARKHYRISNIRLNAIHQATSAIVKKYDRIIIETLRPKNMLKNRNLSKSVHDSSFGEIARQFEYKSKWAAKELVKANQWFASSKICSGCGHKKKELKLSERVYNCENCGLEIDRDLNAAKNLASYSPTCELQGC